MVVNNVYIASMLRVLCAVLVASMLRVFMRGIPSSSRTAPRTSAGSLPHLRSSHALSYSGTAVPLAFRDTSGNNTHPSAASLAGYLSVLSVLLSFSFLSIYFFVATLAYVKYFLYLCTRFASFNSVYALHIQVQKHQNTQWHETIGSNLGITKVAVSI